MSLAFPDFDSVLISDSFDIHIGNNKEYYSGNQQNLRKAFSFSQHVTGANLNLGHTSCLILANEVMLSVTALGVAFSDHYSIFFLK